MPFESLSFRHTIALPDMPSRWLPLVNAYDPDLPLFPIYYFHSVDPTLPAGNRPSISQRVFGYIERINITDAGDMSASIVTNKNLSRPENANYLAAATRNVRDRLGLTDPVTKQDVTSCFSAQHAAANAVLGEIWERVVTDAYGGKLPFGRTWDEVLGLARFVASWNSDAGRKGELIQTHYFATRFGERIQSGGGIPQVDFFLFPTIGELLDQNNPLTNFPAFNTLLRVAQSFRQNFCNDRVAEGITFSAFTNPNGGKFDTKQYFKLLGQLTYDLRPSGTECFNAFGKGPQRTIIFLMMLADLRSGAVVPDAITLQQSGAMYEDLKRTYQSPKVLEIYAQQCFANTSAMPIDTWVETFLKWPLYVWPVGSPTQRYRKLFGMGSKFGKVERLIWVAAQARKVHSQACHDALWCLKKSSGDGTSANVARGANPLACNICCAGIRNVCPAFAQIKNMLVSFNDPVSAVDFKISTSSANNTAANQKFEKVVGRERYGKLIDDDSPKDDPEGFVPFPSDHDGSAITVEDFVDRY